MFLTLFSSIALMLVYMLFGYILCKSKKAVVSHAKSLSAVLLYVLSPAMIINSFLQLEYSPDNIIKMGKYFIITLIVQLLFFVLLYVILHKKYGESRYRIMTVGGVLGNVGFMGMPIVAGIFPDHPIVMVYSSINVMTMNLIVFTVGVFLITNDKKYMSARSALLNPTTLSILVALPLFFFRVSFPEVVGSSIALLAKMVTPMCMIILGMRLSAARLKDVFTRPFVYVTCLLKLIAFPAFAFLLVRWLPFIDDVLRYTVVVLAAVPSAAVIETLAELHECEQEFAANVVLLTTIISVVTIPLMTFLLL